MSALSSSQLRRLKDGFADPIEGRPSITTRKDHVASLVEMIERREQVMMDFIMQIETELVAGDLAAARERCKAFWLSKDKWGESPLSALESGRQ